MQTTFTSAVARFAAPKSAEWGVDMFGGGGEAMDRPGAVAMKTEMIAKTTTNRPDFISLSKMSACALFDKTR
jgi:hypothetical protein